jgi:hypothetical protein
MKFQSLFLVATFLTVQVFAQSIWQTDHDAFARPEGPCLPAADREMMKEEIAKNRAELVERGILGERAGGGNPVMLEYPLKLVAESTWNSAWAISNFVDHDTSSAVLDYNCTQRTYNGHQGTDYFIWPFSFYLMYNDLVEIVAAAPGVIVYKNDGSFDENCEWPGFAVWNAVYIEHTDGTTALYGHMKDGSLTNKNVGDSVVTGEFLGIVGSSGYSTGPHLHLEIWDTDTNWVDPYQGGCNSTNTVSAWTEQRPYWDKAINAMTVHDSIPTNFACPGAEEHTHFDYEFHPGDSVYGYIWVTNIQGGIDTFYTTVNRPDGSLFTDYLTPVPPGFSSPGIPLVAAIELPDTASEGVWTIETQYYGVDTMMVEFNVQTLFASVEDEVIGTLKTYPNPTEDNLFIKLPNTTATREEMDLKVFNSVGKLVLQKSLTNQSGNEINISTTGLTSGVYSVRFSTSEGFWTTTFVQGE